MNPRVNIGMQMGSHYMGGPTITRYTINGLRVPHWAWRVTYRILCPKHLLPR